MDAAPWMKLEIESAASKGLSTNDTVSVTIGANNSHTRHITMHLLVKPHPGTERTRTHE